MPLILAVQTAGAFLERIPTPALLTFSPRVAASAGAAVSAGLLLLMWCYRRRPFILVWSFGWLCIAVAVYLVFDADPRSTVTTRRLALAAGAMVVSSELFLAGLLGHGFARIWSTMPALLVITAGCFASTPGVMSSNLTFAVTFIATAAFIGVSAGQAARIGRRRQMVGSLVMAAAFASIVVCHVAAAIVALTFDVDMSSARLLLLTTSACYVLAAFAQHLFVFEDMLLELKASNHELQAARAELHHAVITDALTSLYNRRLFDEVAAHQLEHHRRFHLPLSLVYIDIDRFKAVNDTHGHDVGDRLLQHVANYLRSQVREADYVFRLGGDEFLILISCSGVEAERKAIELQAGFLETLRAANLPDTVALSVGVTELPPGSRDIAAAVQQADARMYADKRQRASLDAR